MQRVAKRDAGDICKETTKLVVCFFCFVFLCLLYTNNEHLGPFIYMYLSFVTQFSVLISVLLTNHRDYVFVFDFWDSVLFCFLLFCEVRVWFRSRTVDRNGKEVYIKSWKHLQRKLTR